MGWESDTTMVAGLLLSRLAKDNQQYKILLQIGQSHKVSKNSGLRKKGKSPGFHLKEETHQGIPRQK